MMCTIEYYKTTCYYIITIKSQNITEFYRSKVLASTLQAETDLPSIQIIESLATPRNMLVSLKLYLPDTSSVQSWHGLVHMGKLSLNFVCVFYKEVQCYGLFFILLINYAVDLCLNMCVKLIPSFF